MKMKSIKLAKAKSTRFGRMLCRLFGDECGAVMMEYVVVGVLVVAAAVAIVMVFGRSIRQKFHVMVGTLDGDPKTVAEQVQGDRETNMGDADTALETGDTIGNEQAE